MGRTFDVYGTVVQPPADSTEPTLSRIAELAQRAEKNGFTGLLAFYNHRNLDPWMVAAAVIGQTTSLVPLIAVQPYAMSPLTAAKMVSSLVSLYQRRIDLNIITGAAPEELQQVGDALTHDERYQRAKEYVQIVRHLLTEDDPLDWDGRHYRFRGLWAEARLQPNLLPRVFVAGASPASRELAMQIGDVMVTHPEPVATFQQTYVGERLADGPEIAVRLGLLGRPTEEEAWRVARDRYRTTRAGRLQTLLKRESESEWSRRLAALAAGEGVHDDVYWTGLFSSGKAAAPILVGSYEQVARYLERYLDVGVTRLLVAQAETEDDFFHVHAVLAAVRA